MDFGLPCSSIIGGNRNRMGDGTERGRGQVAGAGNPVDAHDTRIFFHPADAGSAFEAADTVDRGVHFLFTLSRATAADHAALGAVSGV